MGLLLIIWSDYSHSSTNAEAVSICTCNYIQVHFIRPRPFDVHDVARKVWSGRETILTEDRKPKTKDSWRQPKRKRTIVSLPFTLMVAFAITLATVTYHVTCAEWSHVCHWPIKVCSKPKLKTCAILWRYPWPSVRAVLSRLRSITGFYTLWIPAT